jgi:hypothetical protein
MQDETQLMVYNQLKALVNAHVPTEFFDIAEEEGKLNVTTKKTVSAGKGKPKPMNLFDVIIQKQHIGFYAMPVYVEPELLEDVPPDVAKMLKGKSCFHVKRELDTEIEQAFVDLIQAGVELYRQKDWL